LAVGKEPDHTLGRVRSLEKTHDPWRVVYAPRSRLGIGVMPDGMPVIVRLLRRVRVTTRPGPPRTVASWGEVS